MVTQGRLCSLFITALACNYEEQPACYGCPNRGQTELGYSMSVSGLPDPWLSRLPFLAPALKALLAGGIKRPKPGIPVFSWVPPLSGETIMRMSCVACLADPYRLQRAGRILAVLALSCCHVSGLCFRHFHAARTPVGSVIAFARWPGKCVEITTWMFWNCISKGPVCRIKQIMEDQNMSLTKSLKRIVLFSFPDKVWDQLRLQNEWEWTLALFAILIPITRWHQILCTTALKSTPNKIIRQQPAITTVSWCC